MKRQKTPYLLIATVVSLIVVVAIINGGATSAPTPPPPPPTPTGDKAPPVAGSARNTPSVEKMQEQVSGLVLPGPKDKKPVNFDEPLIVKKPKARPKKDVPSDNLPSSQWYPKK